MKKDIANFGKIVLAQEVEMLSDDYYGYEEFTI
jgi:hypothetical protein